MVGTRWVEVSGGIIERKEVLQKDTAFGLRRYTDRGSLRLKAASSVYLISTLRLMG